MTSDAKIGLLLGLVFIFAIAFVINGLPRFRTAADSNELTENMVRSQDGTPGIAARERKAQELFSWEERATEPPLDQDQMRSEENEDVRFEMDLPEDIAVSEDTWPEQTVREVEPTSPTTPETVAPSPTADQTIVVKGPESAKPVRPKSYVVSDGDNLGVIALKFYGPVEGNRQVNVTRIFQANRGLLESPHELYVGQKLVIPPLPASSQGKDKTGSSFPSTLFETVKSIGRKPLTDSSQATRSGQYVVQDGDSLWAIAAAQLGSGVRYEEIAELNADVLADDHTLTIGMHLRLPDR